MKRPNRWLDRTLLRSPVYYALCVTEKAFREELKHLDYKGAVPYLSTSHANATAHHFDKTGDSKPTYAIIVTLSEDLRGRTTEQIYGLLVHEAMHIWRCIRGLLGEKEPASEQEAYAMQEISQSLMESYRDQTKRVKK